MPTDWLDVHASAIQGVSSVVLLAVTVVLVVVTFTYAKAAQRQAEQAEKQVAAIEQERLDRQRPIVYPLGQLPLTEDNHVDWAKLEGCDLRLENVGAGVALILCGVLFAPEPDTPPRILPDRFTVWREPPLLPGASRPIKLAIGKTIMNGDAKISEYPLFAPKKPTYHELTMGGRYNVLARLTLTYQDIFKRKHAAVFDYIDLYAWQCVVFLADIPSDLEDVDNVARGVMMRSAMPRFVSVPGGDQLGAEL